MNISNTCTMVIKILSFSLIVTFLFTRAMGCNKELSVEFLMGTERMVT